MGSRASTLLRDEEIEEIKKETGCECGLVGGGCSWAGRRLGRRRWALLTAPGTGMGRPRCCWLREARRGLSELGERRRLHCGWGPLLSPYVVLFFP